jgi:hypothetical protein
MLDWRIMQFAELLNHRQLGLVPWRTVHEVSDRLEATKAIRSNSGQDLLLDFAKAFNYLDRYFVIALSVGRGHLINSRYIQVHKMATRRQRHETVYNIVRDGDT